MTKHIQTDRVIANELAKGSTLAEAADAAGVCTKSAISRVGDPAFIKSVRQLRTEYEYGLAIRLADTIAGVHAGLAGVDTSDRRAVRAALVQFAREAKSWLTLIVSVFPSLRPSLVQALRQAGPACGRRQAWQIEDEREFPVPNL